MPFRRRASLRRHAERSHDSMPFVSPTPVGSLKNLPAGGQQRLPKHGHPVHPTNHHPCRISRGV